MLGEHQCQHTEREIPNELAEIPVPVGSQNVMSQMRGIPFRQYLGPSSSNAPHPAQAGGPVLHPAGPVRLMGNGE